MVVEVGALLPVGGAGGSLLLLLHLEFWVWGWRYYVLSRSLAALA